MKISLAAADEKTVRQNVTTQLEFSLDVWPGNVFCLWLPEVVYADYDDPLWEQWDPPVAHQDFDPTGHGGRQWRFANDRCEIATLATPSGPLLDLETRIVNRSDDVMPHVSAQNCFHFPKAPDFFCLDYTRVWIRANGQWRTVLSTGPKAPPNFFFRTGLPADQFPPAVEDRWISSVRADHPLILVESTDGRRTVGITARGWRNVFHNCHPMLACIHSAPMPAADLKPGETAVFSQRVYHYDGGRREFLSEYGREAYEFGNGQPSPT